MDLVEVNDIGLKPSQAVFAFAPDRTCFQGCTDGAVRIPGAFAFRENVRAWRTSLECARDDFFGMAKSVESSGVDPVESAIEGSVNGRDGIGFVLRTHAALPTATADGPRANTDRSDFEIAVSKTPSFHVGCRPRMDSGSAELAPKRPSRAERDPAIGRAKWAVSLSGPQFDVRTVFFVLDIHERAHCDGIAISGGGK